MNKENNLDKIILPKPGNIFDLTEDNIDLVSKGIKEIFDKEDIKIYHFSRFPHEEWIEYDKNPLTYKETEHSEIRLHLIFEPVDWTIGNLLDLSYKPKFAFLGINENFGFYFCQGSKPEDPYRRRMENIFVRDYKK